MLRSLARRGVVDSRNKPNLVLAAFAFDIIQLLYQCANPALLAVYGVPSGKFSMSCFCTCQGQS